MKKQSSLLRVLSFIFIWLVPLAYVVYVAFDITATTPTNTEGGSRLVFSIWALVILGVLLFVYISNLRKRLIKVLDISDIQGRPVPAF